MEAPLRGHCILLGNNYLCVAENYALNQNKNISGGNYELPSYYKKKKRCHNDQCQGCWPRLSVSLGDGLRPLIASTILDGAASQI